MSGIGLVIYAVELDRLADFYRVALDLETVEADGTYALLVGDGVEVVIQQIPAWIAQDIVVTDPPEVREDTPVKPVFLVGDLGATVARVVMAGGRAKPLDQAWTFRGHTVLDGWDPEGNVVQFRAPER